MHRDDARRDGHASRRSGESIAIDCFGTFGAARLLRLIVNGGPGECCASVTSAYQDVLLRGGVHAATGW